MSILATIADSLHLLGKAIDPQAITKVHLYFDHSQSDLPDQVVWRFKATLTGSKEINEEGAAVAFQQEWSGEGVTEGGAIEEVHKSIVAHLQSFLQLRQDEARFAEQAMMIVCAQQPELGSLWSTVDPSDQGVSG